MARNNDGDRIRTVRQANRAAGFGVADAARQLPVRDCPSVRDVQQLTPHSLLERRALRAQRHGEVFELSRKVRTQLTNRFLQSARTFNPCRTGLGRAIFGWEDNLPEPGLIGDEKQAPDGTLKV